MAIAQNNKKAQHYGVMIVGLKKLYVSETFIVSQLHTAFCLEIYRRASI